MKKICDTASTSPLCNNKPMYDVLKAIATSYDVPVWLILWIMAHESRFWTSYHKSNLPTCRENTNNRWGMKATHTTEWVKKTNTIWAWCWLQKYDTIEAWFTSLVRTIWIWYKGCLVRDRQDIATCISYKYVWLPNVSERTRVDHVNSFL